MPSVHVLVKMKHSHAFQVSRIVDNSIAELEKSLQQGTLTESGAKRLAAAKVHNAWLEKGLQTDL